MGRVRIERLSSLIASTVAELIQRRLKDPRVQQATVTSVALTPNLQHAKIYYAVLGDSEEDQKAAAAGFEKAKGFIRSTLYRTLAIKRVPELQFVLDKNSAHAARINKLIFELVPPGTESEAQGDGGVFEDDGDDVFEDEGESEAGFAGQGLDEDGGDSQGGPQDARDSGPETDPPAQKASQP